MTHRFPWLRISLVGIGGGFLLGFGLPSLASYLLADGALADGEGRSPSLTPVAQEQGTVPAGMEAIAPTPEVPCQDEGATRFLVVGGGGAPSYNEIALEKNVLYFQRTLQAMGLDPAAAQIYFANGNDGRATVRYIDEQGQMQFKVPDIPNLIGASTLHNVQQWATELGAQESQHPVFFYFTGHGLRNEQNLNNNYMALWGDQMVSVQQLARVFDTLPSESPLVAMMAQCYSGSFANLMYEGGDPVKGMARQNRCGFFATIRSLPSVGCTPEVNEADYEDYSSSFFAGLSGINRVGERVPSADYDQNGKVTYREAHAFAKVDEEATDLPVSTSEVWLQEQAAIATQDEILDQPVTTLLITARPEQRYVVESLAEQMGFDMSQSYTANRDQIQSTRALGDIPLTYMERIRMELINIGMEARIRASGDGEAIATLDRLLSCENSSWQ